MSQFIRPTSDISTGSWATTPLWSKLDDNSDADYVTSDVVVGDSFRVHLGNPDDPLVSTGHIIRARWRRASGTTAGAKLRLYQGSTLIATLTNSSLGGSFATSSLTLTGAQADSITDYTDLRLDVEFYTGTGIASVDVAWVEMELPSLTAPDAPTGVSAEDGNPSRVRVTYTPGARAVDNNIYRNTSNSWSGATKIYDGDLASPYDDTPTAGIQYWYGVRSSNDAGESPNSSLNSGYRLAAPAAPTGIAASKGTYADHVHVQATDASGAFDGADSFKAYRNTVNDSATATLIASGLATPSYDDYTVVAGTTYYWWFKGHNDAGDGPFSTTDTGFAAAADEGAGSFDIAIDFSGTGNVGTTYAGSGAFDIDIDFFGSGAVGAGGLYGRLDRLASSYVWDQRPAALKVALARGDEIVAGPIPLLTAETTGIRHDANTLMAVVLSDLSRRLKVVAQPITLNGTGGIEGDASVAGRIAPLCIGYAKHVPGIRLESNGQRYLVHRDIAGNRIREVVMVTVGGNLIDAGDYDVLYDSGANIVDISRIDVLDGQEVRFWVRGPLLSLDATADADSTTLADAVRYLIHRRPDATYPDVGVLDTAAINWTALSRFALQVPFEVGWYIDSDVQIADVLKSWLSPWTVWGMDALGTFTVTLNLEPSLSPDDYELDDADILDARKVETFPPAKQIAVGYDVNWGQLSPNQLVGAAAGSSLALWLISAYRRIAVTSGSWVAVYPTARKPEDYITPFLDADAAAIVHGWIAGVVGVPVLIYTVRASFKALLYEPGKVVRIARPRWGMDTAAPYRIADVEIKSDGDRWVVLMTVWRTSTRYVLSGNVAGSYLTNENGAPIGI